MIDDDGRTLMMMTPTTTTTTHTTECHWDSKWISLNRRASS